MHARARTAAAMPPPTRDDARDAVQSGWHDDDAPSGPAPALAAAEARPAAASGRIALGAAAATAGGARREASSPSASAPRRVSRPRLEPPLNAATQAAAKAGVYAEVAGGGAPEEQGSVARRRTLLSHQNEPLPPTPASPDSPNGGGGVIGAGETQSSDQQHLSFTRRQSSLMQMQRKVAALVQSGKVRVEVEDAAEIRGISILQQGNLDMYTDDAIAKRVALSEHPEVRLAMDRWWHVITNTHPNGFGKHEFVGMNLRIQKVLLPHFSAKEGLLQACKDWHTDSRGLTKLDYDVLYASMFELADLWAPDAEAASYALFLDSLLREVAKVPPWPPVAWAHDRKMERIIKAKETKEVLNLSVEAVDLLLTDLEQRSTKEDAQRARSRLSQVSEAGLGELQSPASSSRPGSSHGEVGSPNAAAAAAAAAAREEIRAALSPGSWFAAPRGGVGSLRQGRGAAEPEAERAAAAAQAAMLSRQRIEEREAVAELRQITEAENDAEGGAGPKVADMEARFKEGQYLGEGYYGAGEKQQLSRSAIEEQYGVEGYEFFNRGDVNPNLLNAHAVVSSGRRRNWLAAKLLEGNERMQRSMSEVKEEEKARRSQWTQAKALAAATKLWNARSAARAHGRGAPPPSQLRSLDEATEEWSRTHPQEFSHGDWEGYSEALQALVAQRRRPEALARKVKGAAAHAAKAQTTQQQAVGSDGGDTQSRRGLRPYSAPSPEAPRRATRRSAGLSAKPNPKTGDDRACVTAREAASASAASSAARRAESSAQAVTRRTGYTKVSTGRWRNLHRHGSAGTNAGANEGTGAISRGANECADEADTAEGGNCHLVADAAGAIPHFRPPTADDRVGDALIECSSEGLAEDLGGIVTTTEAAGALLEAAGEFLTSTGDVEADCGGGAAELGAARAATAGAAPNSSSADVVPTLVSDFDARPDTSPMPPSPLGGGRRCARATPASSGRPWSSHLAPSSDTFGPTRKPPRRRSHAGHRAGSAAALGAAVAPGAASTATLPPTYRRAQLYAIRGAGSVGVSGTRSMGDRPDAGTGASSTIILGGARAGEHSGLPGFGATRAHREAREVDRWGVAELGQAVGAEPLLAPPAAAAVSAARNGSAPRHGRRAVPKTDSSPLAEAIHALSQASLGGNHNDVASGTLRRPKPAAIGSAASQAARRPQSHAARRASRRKAQGAAVHVPLQS